MGLPLYAVAFCSEGNFMVLAIDIGNTNIVFGIISFDVIQFVARTSTDKTKTSDQYAIQFKSILELYDVDVNEIDGCIISSVVPSVFNEVSRAVTTITGIEPMSVGPGIKTGLNILIDNPAQLGSDLVVNAVAALNEYKPPIIIIDMGTATTISVVDLNENYIGGIILPGMRISLDALCSTAAQLPAIKLEQPKRVIGKNTIECMTSGIINGNAAMIDGMIERIEDEIGERAIVVATGGLAGEIVKNCRKEVIFDSDLLLKGLYIIYEKNKQI